MRMLDSMLGRESLLQGLALYLARHQSSNVAGRDLFLALEEAAQAEGSWPQPGVSSLLRTMAKWTQQSGFPLVTATHTGSSLSLTQSPYLQVQSRSSNTS